MAPLNFKQKESGTESTVIGTITKCDTNKKGIPVLPGILLTRNQLKTYG